MGHILRQIFLGCKRSALFCGFISVFQDWNRRDRVNGPAMFETGADIMTKIEASIKSVEHLVEECRGNLGRGTRPQLESFMRHAERIVDEMEKIRISELKLFSFAWWYIVIWQLALPTLAAVVAIAWSVFAPLSVT